MLNFRNADLWSSYSPTMRADDIEIVDYLKPIKEFVSPKVIARHVGGRERFEKNPSWAKPVLIALAHKGVLEVDQFGHFRYKPPPEKRLSRKMSLAPNILQILKASGKNFNANGPDDPIDHGVVQQITGES